VSRKRRQKQDDGDGEQREEALDDDGDHADE
jgi:hypothetical protein